MTYQTVFCPPEDDCPPYSAETYRLNGFMQQRNFEESQPKTRRSFLERFLKETLLKPLFHS
ncbi:MAG: hypothetical protein AABW47_02915 [Nanoarchaeota archaeon]